MNPIENITCAVCNGVVYKEAHYEVVEGDLRVFLGSNECAIAIARSMKETGLSLKEATEVPPTETLKN